MRPLPLCRGRTACVTKCQLVIGNANTHASTDCGSLPLTPSLPASRRRTSAAHHRRTAGKHCRCRGSGW